MDRLDINSNMRDEIRHEIMALRYARGITKLEDIERAVSQTLIEMAKGGDMGAIMAINQ